MTQIDWLELAKENHGSFIEVGDTQGDAQMLGIKIEGIIAALIAIAERLDRLAPSVPIVGTVDGPDSTVIFDPDRCAYCGRTGGQCSH